MALGAGRSEAVVSRVVDGIVLSVAVVPAVALFVAPVAPLLSGSPEHPAKRNASENSMVPWRRRWRRRITV